MYFPILQNASADYATIDIALDTGHGRNRYVCAHVSGRGDETWRVTCVGIVFGNGFQNVVLVDGPNR